MLSIIYPMNKYIVWEKERDFVSGVGKALTEMVTIERKPKQKSGGLQAEAGSIKDGSLPLLSNSALVAISGKTVTGAEETNSNRYSL